MRHKELRLGSITLLFTVVVLCVAALCALTIATAHADAAVADKYAEQVDAYYAAERVGQEWLAQVDDILARKGAQLSQSDLPEGAVWEDGSITTELQPGNGRSLCITLELTDTPQRYRILCWENTALWEESSELDGLWSGEIEADS